jgi:rare lipoprotein A (peptidoglycan hydrolase)
LFANFRLLWLFTHHENSAPVTYLAHALIAELLMRHWLHLFCALILLGLMGCRSVARFTSGSSAPPAAAPRSEVVRSAPPLSAPAASVSAQVLSIEEGLASYYAMEFHGRRTSSGEIFDAQALTAAHLHLPFGTRVRVTNLTNNKSVIVRINDRLPPNSKGRIIDLSPSAAQHLEMIQAGVVKVRIEVLAN